MHIWPSKQVMKTSKTWEKMDKEYKYDILGLSNKEIEQINIAKSKRTKRKQEEDEQ